MSDPLSGAQLKYDRGSKHVNTLHEEVARFMDKDARRILEKYKPDTGSYERQIIEGAPTPPEWSLLLGEIAHNFRSCLDHIAWQLAIAASPTGKPKDHWKNVADISFPLLASRSEYLAKKRRKPVWRLDGLLPYHARQIRKCQPYLRRDAPKTHPLWHLSRLSNIDKHQVLHTTLVGLDERFPPPGTFTKTLTDPETGEIEYVYEFSTPEGYTLADPDVAEVILNIGGPSQGDVQLYGNLPFEVEIQQPGTVLHEQPMLGLVDGIRAAVGSALGAFKPLL
jgi:hypothetical protein